MREIKFRAWIKSYKHDSNVPISQRTDFGFPKMVIPMGVYSEHGFEYRENLSIRQITQSKYDFELMQYTGLQDVNGVDIYEGDIVDDGISLGVVKYVFEHAAFIIATTVKGNREFHFIESDGILRKTKVVGNVFENPELLKEE